MSDYYYCNKCADAFHESDLVVKPDLLVTDPYPMYQDITVSPCCGDDDYVDIDPAEAWGVFHSATTQLRQARELLAIESNGLNFEAMRKFRYAAENLRAFQTMMEYLEE